MEELLVPDWRSEEGHHRGSLDYDQKKMGFLDREEAGVTVFYDVRLSGNSNAGHSSKEFLGDVDWKKEEQMRKELLEYLKTL